MDKQTWELIVYNTNHMEIPPHVVIMSSSYELCDYLMNNLADLFRNNGYKSFKIMLKCVESGAIIRDWRSA